MNECNCTFAQTTTGDGCAKCNPDFWIEHLKDEVDDLREELEQVRSQTIEDCAKVVEKYSKRLREPESFTESLNMKNMYEHAKTVDNCAKAIRSIDNDKL